MGKHDGTAAALRELEGPATDRVHAALRRCANDSFHLLGGCLLQPPLDALQLINVAAGGIDSLLSLALELDDGHHEAFVVGSTTDTLLQELAFASQWCADARRALNQLRVEKFRAYAGVVGAELAESLRAESEGAF